MSVGRKAKINADELINDGFAAHSPAANALDAFCGAGKRELDVNVLADREVLRLLPSALVKLAEKVKQATGIYR
jgi:hypothetical protein